MPLMAAETDRRDTREALVFRQRLMGIVAGDTSDAAFDVAETMAKAIGVMIDLEALVARPSPLVDVDVQHVVAEGFAGTE